MNLVKVWAQPIKECCLAVASCILLFFGGDMLLLHFLFECCSQGQRNIQQTPREWRPAGAPNFAAAFWFAQQGVTNKWIEANLL